LLVLHTPKGKPNKMLKWLFSPTNAIPKYLFKEPKPTKWGHQKNKPIKCRHVEKKVTSNLLRNNKTLVSSTPI